MICSYCGYPINIANDTIDASEPIGGYVKHFGCDTKPAYVTLRKLQKQLDELEARLRFQQEDRLQDAKNFRIVRNFQKAIQKEGQAEVLGSAIVLLYQARAGTLGAPKGVPVK